MPQQERFDVVAEVRKKYPALKDWSDQEIISNLQDPTKFRSAFPEYASLNDVTIRTNMAQYKTKGEPPELVQRMASLAMKAKQGLPQPERMSGLPSREAMVVDPIGGVLATLLSPIGRQGIQNAAMMPVEAAKTFSEGSKTGIGIPNPLMGGVNVAKEMIVRPMAQQLSMATDASRTPAERIARAITGSIPLAGPYVATIGERLGSEAPLEGLIETGAELATGAGIAKVIPPIARVLPKTPEGVRILTQKTLGLGESLTEKAIQKRASKIAKQETAFEKSKGQAVQRARQEHMAEFNKAEIEHARKVAETRAKDQAKFARETEEWKAATQEQKQLIEKRVSSEAKIESLAESTRENLRMANSVLNDTVDTLYSQVRERVASLGPDPVQSAPILERMTVEASKLGGIEGVPVARQLKSVTKAETLADASVFRGAGVEGRGAGLSQWFMDSFKAASPEAAARLRAGLTAEEAGLLDAELSGTPILSSRNLPWQVGQNLYTLLGKMLDSPFVELGYRRRAVASIREAIGQELKSVAEKAGAGKTLELAQNLHSRRLTAFENRRLKVDTGAGKMKGDTNPLAAILRTENPRIIAQIINRSGGRAAALMQGLKDVGVSPELVQRMLTAIQDLKKLPSPKKGEIRQPIFEPSPEPTFEPPNVAKIRFPEKPEEIAPVDPGALKLRRIQKMLENASPYYFRWHPVRTMAGATILRSKTLQKALSKPSAKELEMARRAQ